MTVNLNVDSASKHKFRTADLRQENEETSPMLLQMPVEILTEIASWVATGDTLEPAKNAINFRHVCVFTHLVYHALSEKINQKLRSNLNVATMDLAHTIAQRQLTSREEGRFEYRWVPTVRQKDKDTRSMEKFKMNVFYQLFKAIFPKKDSVEFLRQLIPLLEKTRDLCLVISIPQNEAQTKQLDSKIESVMKRFTGKIVGDMTDEYASQPLYKIIETFEEKSLKMGDLFLPIFRRTSHVQVVEIVKSGIFFRKILAYHPLQEIKDVIDQLIKNDPNWVAGRTRQFVISTVLKENKEDQIKNLKKGLGYECLLDPLVKYMAAEIRLRSILFVIFKSVEKYHAST